MNAIELRDYITQQMPAEDALLILLKTSLVSYEHLKFSEEESVHPCIIIAMAALDMGWEMAVDNQSENVNGMIIGNKEYIDKILNK